MKSLCSNNISFCSEAVFTYMEKANFAIWIALGAVAILSGCRGSKASNANPFVGKWEDPVEIILEIRSDHTFSQHSGPNTMKLNRPYPPNSGPWTRSGDNIITTPMITGVITGANGQQSPFSTPGPTIQYSLSSDGQTLYQGVTGLGLHKL